MDRFKQIQAIQERPLWDIIVIGGGSSGLGVALDAVSRGLSVLVLEKSDFAKGTSSRSTKLIHGGVRYLAQGHLRLVFEALYERGLLISNANHLSKKQAFVIPLYSRFNQLKYWIGLKIYDWMSGRLSLGKSEIISKKRTLELIPHLNNNNLKGGVLYFDGQFDDARLAINLAQTIIEKGGSACNYMGVVQLLKNTKSFICGVQAKDQISGELYEIKAKMVVNATGVFADEILSMDHKKAVRTIQPSQGIHLVFDKNFTQSDKALMIPKTSDGRILFAVPWKESLIMGTTDTLVEKPSLEPDALKSEVAFILETAKGYLNPAPTFKDIKAVYAGLRPLAKTSKETKTKEISRSHKVLISKSKLVSLIGGKWTTFRRMGQDTVDVYFKLTNTPLIKSQSEHLKIHGAFADKKQHENRIDLYGTDTVYLKKLTKENSSFAELLHPNFTHIIAEVIWAIRHEMAITVDDVLSRRIRLLFQDVEAAIEVAPKVASIMAKELKKDKAWELEQLSSFAKIAKKFMPHLED